MGEGNAECESWKVMEGESQAPASRRFVLHDVRARGSRVGRDRLRWY